mgnify:FL=1
MAKEIIIPGVSQAFDRLRSDQEGRDTGTMLIPEIRLDGSTSAFYRAYAKLLRTYRRRLQIESYERLMPEIGRRVAQAIQITAQLQGKTTDLSDSPIPVNIFRSQLVLDITEPDDIVQLVYPKLVVFESDDLVLSVETGLAIIYKSDAPKLQTLLQNGKVFVV